jgi:hypothetical protein
MVASYSFNIYHISILNNVARAMVASSSFNTYHISILNDVARGLRGKRIKLYFEGDSIWA